MSDANTSNRLPDFVLVPMELALDPSLTKNELRLMIALLSFRNKNTDLVWPRREKLAVRSGMPLSRISTVTSDLVKKGWLEKLGNGGRSRSCRYRVTTPDFSPFEVSESGRVSRGKTVTETETVTECETVTKTETVTESETVTEPVNKTVTESVTKTVTEPVRGIEQTIEQTKEQTNIGAVAPTSPKKYRGVDLSELPQEVPAELAKAFIDHRHTLKKPVSQHGFGLFCLEVCRAPAFGLTVAQVINEGIEAGWTGYKCEWVVNRLQQHGVKAVSSGGGAAPRDTSLAEQLTDTSWASGVKDLHDAIEGEVIDVQA